jgi:hypothetical protein
MRKLIPVLLVFTILYSCGYREGIIQKAEKSYIQFSGNIQNAQIQIDDMDAFVIQAEPGKEKPYLYQVQPGKHLISIYRNSQLIIKKIVFIDNQATMEVEIP